MKMFFVLTALTCYTTATAQTQQKIQLQYQPPRAGILQRYQHMALPGSTARNAFFKCASCPTGSKPATACYAYIGKWITGEGFLIYR